MTLQKEVILEIEADELKFLMQNYAKKTSMESLRGIVEEISNNLSDSFIDETIEFTNSLNPCQCVSALADKTHLSHRERLVLLNLLMWRGEENQLREILQKQDNYKEKITDYQIESWKRKGGNKPIKKVTLKEWGICHCN